MNLNLWQHIQGMWLSSFFFICPTYVAWQSPKGNSVENKQSLFILKTY